MFVHRDVQGIRIRLHQDIGEVSALPRRHRGASATDHDDDQTGDDEQVAGTRAQSVYMSSLADYHDLDAPQLLETDIAQGIVYEKETIHVDREIIGGPALKREVIEKLIRE